MRSEQASNGEMMMMVHYLKAKQGLPSEKWKEISGYSTVLVSAGVKFRKKRSFCVAFRHIPAHIEH
jgi:hypothetical protein